MKRPMLPAPTAAVGICPASRDWRRRGKPGYADDEGSPCAPGQRPGYAAVFPTAAVGARNIGRFIVFDIFGV